MYHLGNGIQGVVHLPRSRCLLVERMEKGLVLHHLKVVGGCCCGLIDVIYCEWIGGAGLSQGWRERVVAYGLCVCVCVCMERYT